MEMSLQLIINGLAAGFMLAAAVGPVGIICIKRTLVDGRLVGFVSGLGSALADSMYAGVAALGVAILSETLESRVVLLQFVGGIFLCFLGIHIYLSKQKKPKVSKSFSNLIGAFSTTFFLTAVNPLVIFSFAAIFTSTRLTSAGGTLASSLVLMASVFIGAIIFWLIIVFLATFMRERLQPAHMQWMNRFVGILIATFGSLALLELMLTHQNIFDAMQGY